MKKIVLFILILILLASCKTLQNNGENYVADDIPPVGYNPIFVTNKTEYDKSRKDSLQINISNVRYEGNKTTAFVHLINDNNTLLTNASNKKDIWCEIIDSTSLGEKVIKSGIVEYKDVNSSPISLAIVMDHSGSMGEERAKNMQIAVQKLIENKREQDRITLIRYDNKIAIHAGPDKDKNTLKLAHQINGLQGYGNLTATKDAIIKAVSTLENEPLTHKRAVVVFTDGYDNSSKLGIDDVVKSAREKNIFVSTVDYGYNVDEKMLQEIANRTYGIYHHIYLTHEFNYVFEDVYTRLNNYYLIEYDVDSFGEHKLKLKICIDGKEYIDEYSYNNTPPVGSLVLLNVLFDHDKSTLKKESKNAVKMLADYMKSNPTLKIELHGHTDNTGNPEYNLKLSDKRAETVKNELVALGIDDNRISFTGHGDTKPIADNNTNDGRANNRRTEFLLK
jgi:flagellar motor protein MotB